MNIIADFGGSSGFPFCNRTWHLISIYTGDSKSDMYLTKKRITFLKEIGMGDHLSLKFWDITDDPKYLGEIKKRYPDYLLFNKEQAKQVVKFLEDRKKERGGDVLCLHCDAGVSRSGAVAEFACEFYGLDRGEFLNENPYLVPNPTVLRLLRETAGMDIKSAFMEGMRKDEVKRKKAFDKLLDKYAGVFV